MGTGETDGNRDTIAAWKALIDRITPPDERQTIEHVAALVATDGRGCEGFPPVHLILFEWDDDIGTDFDAANALYLSEDHEPVGITRGPGGSGSAWLLVGRQIFSADGECDVLNQIMLDLDYLIDHPLLDEERHRAYLDEHIGRAWDEWLRDDVWHDIRRRLPHGHGPDDPFSNRAWWDRERIIRHAYMSAEPEWVAETAVSVVNTRHDECVTAVLSTVYGITPAHRD